MKTEISALAELQRLLRSSGNNAIEKKVFVGFDGSVDKIKKAVKSATFIGNNFNCLKNFNAVHEMVKMLNDIKSQ